ncbi:precorrin-3B synthase [Actinoplanes derwentensis]|nr:precorrin-3B synthase [Actinoplanes derwentensis]
MAHRRTSETDACPGALRLHAAADGMLARVRLPGGMLSGARLRSLRELAEEFGDGALELTSRANLQLRGLGPGDAPALAARLRSAGLLPSTTHDNVRNIAAPPLPVKALRVLVDELDRAILGDPLLPALPGKFLFAIGHVPLASDVAAIPVGVSDDQGESADPLFAVRFAGHDTGVRVESTQVAPALIAAAHAFLSERDVQRDTRTDVQQDTRQDVRLAGGSAVWRLRELRDGPGRVSARVVAALGLTPVAVEVAVPVGATEPGDLIGIVPQQDGLVAVAALVPLGRLTGVQLRVLEDADHLVVTPWRGVLVADLPPEAAQPWADRLAGAGLAVTPGSPWSGVTACAGRPGCAKSLADVRADAVAAARFVDGLPVHWAGCARACGSPAGPHVLAEATTNGYMITRRPAPGSGPGGESGLVGPSTAAAGSLRIGGAEPVTAGPRTRGLGDVVAVARRA